MTGSEPLQTRRIEVGSKLERVRGLLEQRGLDGALLTTPGNVSWITAGAENPIIRGSDAGAFCWVLVTPGAALLITQNVEGPRLVAEERLEELGFSVVQHPWYAPDLWKRTVEASASTVGADVPGYGAELATDLVRLRLHLVASETERLRVLCQDGARALEGALHETRRGDRERDVAARVLSACERQGITLPVLLVGSGDRMRRFRHCPPTDAVIEQDAMTVIVGVRRGLNVACTRMISFGPPDEEIAQRQEVAARVEAAMMAATRTDRTFGDALQTGVEAYEALGWSGEHEHHYQGGPIGYGVREFGPAPRSRPDIWTDEPIPRGCACAWNPTVRGGKSEDTFLVGEREPEVLTTSDWPERSIQVDGIVIRRPAILEL